MKKVGFVLPKCFPCNNYVNSGVVGGSQSRAILLLRGFIKQGYYPTVFSLNYSDNPQDMGFEGCKLFQSGDPATEEGRQKGYERIEKAIKEEGFTDVYFFLTKSAGLSYQFELIKKLSLKLNIYVLLLRSDYISEFSEEDIQTLSKTKYIVAQQEIEKRKLLERGIEPNKIMTIPNPVNVKKFCPVREKQKKILREALGIPENTFVVLSTSRFVKEKGVQYFLEALKSFPKEERVLGVIVGTGENKDELKMIKRFREKETNFNIYLAGKVLYEEMPYWYQISDAFVSNSCAEGFSNSLLEACASGLPIIATDIEENKILVKDNLNGYLYEYGDTKSLTEKISLLISDEILSKQFGKASRDIVVEKYESNYITKRFVALLGKEG